MTDFIEYKGADFSKYTLDVSNIHDETGEADTHELASTISGKQSTPEHVRASNNDFYGNKPKITISEDIQTSVLVTDSDRDDGDDHLIETFLKTHGDSSVVFVFNTKDKEMEVFHGPRITSISDNNSSNINADLNSYFDAGDTETLVTRGISDYNEVRIANKDQLATHQVTPSMVDQADEESIPLVFGVLGLMVIGSLGAMRLGYLGVNKLIGWYWSRQIKEAAHQYELESAPDNVENIALYDTIYDTDFLAARKEIYDSTIKKLVAHNFTKNLASNNKLLNAAINEPHFHFEDRPVLAYIKKEVL